jgi:hypothetical protein
LHSKEEMKTDKHVQINNITNSVYRQRRRTGEPETRRKNSFQHNRNKNTEMAWWLYLLARVKSRAAAV